MKKVNENVHNFFLNNFKYSKIWD